MNELKHMTAKVLTARSQPAMPVRNDRRWSGFASIGIALQRNRRFVRESAS